MKNITVISKENNKNNKRCVITKKLKAGVCALALAGVISLSTVTTYPSFSYAENNAKKPTTEQALKDNVVNNTNKKTEEKRKEIYSEAITALQEAENALKALDNGKKEDALKSLEKATGKLDILIAKDPDIAFIPVGVSAQSHDVIATPEMAESAIKEVQNLLKKGRVQAARALLSTLASEVDIKVTSLPMATYPNAMKKAASLIAQDKIDEAKIVLQTALSTLSVDVTIIPIPVTNAEMLLDEAEKLAETKERNAQTNMELKDLLDAATKEIKLAEILGYGTKKDFDNFYKEIDAIRKKTADGKHGTGFFEKIKSYMNDIIGNSNKGNKTPEKE